MVIVDRQLDGLLVESNDLHPDAMRQRISARRVHEFAVQVISEVHQTTTAREPWQAGDVMLVDNVGTAHSKEAFEGPRGVLVAMADAVLLADSSPTVKVSAR